MDQVPEDVHVRRFIDEIRSDDEARKLWNVEPGVRVQRDADIILCKAIAVAVKGDRDWIERLFKMSGMYPRVAKRWDVGVGRTYGQKVIDRALFRRKREENQFRGRIDRPLITYIITTEDGCSRKAVGTDQYHELMEALRKLYPNSEVTVRSEG